MGPGENWREAWECKIGNLEGVEIPNAADFPMREAVRQAYKSITGKEPEALFSGWGARFDENERRVIENQKG